MPEFPRRNKMGMGGGTVKVAFFNDTYHPYVSGVITSMERFASSLKDAGHQVMLVVPGHIAAPSREHQSRGVYELFSIPVPGFDGMRIGTPIMSDGHLSLSKRLDEGIDIIHAHSPFVVGRMGARLAEKRDVPLVFTCHSIYPNYSDYVPLMSELAGDVIREYVVDYCSRCDLILAPSQYVRSVLWEWGVSRDIRVLPSGIEIEELDRARREVEDSPEAVRRSLVDSMEIPREATLLLFVGRLDHRKNIDFLFDVLNRLPLQLRAELVVVGEGPARSQLIEQAAERGVSRRVHFAGKLPFDEVARWYAASDVFCFPSQIETQGLVLVEAMAAGLPVVALESPTSEETVEDGINGLLAPGDPGAFAERIHSLLDRPEMAEELRKAGLKEAAAFSNEALTAKLIGYYEALVKETAIRRAKGGPALGRPL